MSEKIKTLYVDDSESVLAEAKHYLNDMGFDVSTCNSSLTALEILEKDSSYEFLILDYNMPDLNGIELLAKVRESNSAIANILTFVVSAQMPMQARQWLKEYKVGCWFMKPAKWERVASVAKSQMEAAKAPKPT